MNPDPELPQTPLGAVYLSDHTQRWSSGRGRKGEIPPDRVGRLKTLFQEVQWVIRWVLGSPNEILDPWVPIHSMLSQNSSPPPVNSPPACCSVSRANYLPTGLLNPGVVSQRICGFRRQKMKVGSFRQIIINSYYKFMNQQFLFTPTNLKKRNFE